MACGLLVPQPGIELVPPVVEAQSPNHWTAREFPSFFLKMFLFTAPNTRFFPLRATTDPIYSWIQLYTGNNINICIHSYLFNLYIWIKLHMIMVKAYLVGKKTTEEPSSSNTGLPQLVFHLFLYPESPSSMMGHKCYWKHVKMGMIAECMLKMLNWATFPTPVQPSFDVAPLVSSTSSFYIKSSLNFINFYCLLKYATY